MQILAQLNSVDFRDYFQSFLIHSWSDISVGNIKLRVKNQIFPSRFHREIEFPVGVENGGVHIVLEILVENVIHDIV